MQLGPLLCAMSALPPIADMCGANADVCFGPKADIVSPERKKDRLAAVSASGAWSGGSHLGAGLQKGQEIRINRVRMGGYHAVRQALVGF